MNQVVFIKTIKGLRGLRKKTKEAFAHCLATLALHSQRHGKKFVKKLNFLPPFFAKLSNIICVILEKGHSLIAIFYFKYSCKKQNKKSQPILTSVNLIIF